MTATYLTGDVGGGATRFCGGIVDGVKRSDADVACAVGRALLFQHVILHEGALVTSGHKYTVRTDVEYAGESRGAWLQAALGVGGSPRQNQRRARSWGGVIAIFVALLVVVFAKSAPCVQ